MAERKWTEDQNNAIKARGGTLLLSAAAGSGKTAVLVERIIGLLTDENDPVSPEELLVVTFTNNAAAEMRTRINAAVDKLIENAPENYFYRNIKMKLPDAQISTIDSFCIKLVRENFHSAGISPDFKLLDNSELNILSSEAMSKTLDDLCKNDPDSYDMLNSMTSYNHDDSDLSGKIMKLYNFSLSHPFPDKWLRDTENMYAPVDDVTKTDWGRIIIKEMKLVVDYGLSVIESGIHELPKCPEIFEKYYDVFVNDKEKLIDLKKKTENAAWDEIYNAVKDFSLLKLPSAPRGFGKDPVKLCTEAKHKCVAELMREVSGYFCANTDEHNDDLAVLRPVIHSLIESVREFGRNYSEIKEEHGGYGFSDIMHKALSLLATETDGRIVRSPLAYALSSQFREILIDEYQDTNEAQDMLFNLVSKNSENLFMVGDVKQSIYKFRLAMPELFVRKSRDYSDYSTGRYPAKIILNKNFRSRKGVLDNINYLFSNIMSEEAGDMNYTDSEALHFGEGYPDDTVPGMELHFVQSKEDCASAEYIAGIIKKMLADGTTVIDKNGERKATYSDFCILLRSTKNKADVYEKVLSENGIPVFGEKKGGLFDATEINVFMSLLKAIDNPADDVALLALMFSPMYGFTADDAAKIKIPDKRRNLYSCLSASDDPKAVKILADLDEYRRMSAVMPFEMFIRTLLDVTGYAAIVSALKGGDVRKTNLIMLCEIASKYDENGGTGLGGFIRHVNRAVENGAEIPAASAVSADADVVRVYSIHKSKGLEFPFVILSDCEKTFNMSDIKADMIISPGAGVGMMIQDNGRLKKYSTLCHAASKIAVKHSLMSEELRILYVALTRAKERVICVSNVSDMDKELQKIAPDVTDTLRIHPCSVLNAKNYMQWLLMGYMSHPDMAHITTFDGMVAHDFKNAESSLKVIADGLCEKEGNEAEENTAAADDALIRDIKARTEYKYPYEMPEGARPKRIASDFEKDVFTEEYFAAEKPSFLYGGKLSAAEAGTANHLFLQCCDFRSRDVERELNRLVANGTLTELQRNSVRVDKMKKFIASDLFKRIENAERVYREKEFTVELPLGTVDPSANENVKNEKVLILGKADLVFIENGQAVVVDYKTDRSKTEAEFIAAYEGQLKMYKLAMEQILDVPVKETLIYSLHLEKTIYV